MLLWINTCSADCVYTQIPTGLVFLKESIHVFLITPIQVFTFYSWWGRAKLWGWIGRSSSLKGIEQNVPGTNVLNWSKNKFQILLGKKFKIKLPWMYHKGRPLKVFCCARQASKCSHFLLTTVTCTQLANIFLPSSFCSHADAFLFYLHYKTGFKSCLKMWQRWRGQIADGALADWDITGSWNVLRLRESKGAQLFQMQLEGSKGLISALWSTLQIFQLVKCKVTLSEISYFIIQL